MRIEDSGVTGLKEFTPKEDVPHRVPNRAALRRVKFGRTPKPTAPAGVAHYTQRRVRAARLAERLRKRAAGEVGYVGKYRRGRGTQFYFHTADLA